MKTFYFYFFVAYIINLLIDNQITKENLIDFLSILMSALFSILLSNIFDKLKNDKPNNEHK